MDPFVLTVINPDFLSQEGGALAEYVHYVDMPAITDAACNATYGGAPPVFDHNVCTGNLEEGGVGACSGDLGGPVRRHFS